MENKNLKELLDNLVKVSHESECLEFKHNFHSAEEIGERISALSNGACIKGQQYGYLVFGVEDNTHRIVGTTFKAKSHKKGNEILEHWLASRLNPRIDFAIYEFDYDAIRHISLYEIPATKNQPVEFLHQAYIRVGSITRKINDFPEKQAKIWKKQTVPFEKEIAKDNLSTPLNDLTKKEKIYACYQHACLKYVSNEKMTNQTLRNRFEIEDRNYSIASRIIRDTIDEGLIKEDDPENNSRKYASYRPFWA